MSNEPPSDSTITMWNRPLSNEPPFSTITMYVGDVRDVMAQLEDNHADLIVTSPPFLALRSYLPADHPDKHREIGSEPTPAAFLDTLYGLSADWGRLLPEWGSLCVELGDTMSSHDSGTSTTPNPAYGNGSRHAERGTGATSRRNMGEGWPKTKSMCLLPHSYTIGLAYGINPLTGTPSPAGRWRIRNVITWARPNPPVGSLGKRNPTKRTGDQKFRPACSFITVACRGTGRYFDLDAVRVECSPNTQPRTAKGAGRRENSGKAAASERGGGWSTLGIQTSDPAAGAPPLDWHADDLDGDWLWKLATAPYPGSHYATYPLTLPRRLVLAMCPERVCTVCGWPSERETGPTEYVNSRTGKPTTTLHLRNGHKIDGQGLSTNTAGQGDRAAVAQRETTGWTDCGHKIERAGGITAAWRPGRVLDPFGGSGTTAVAAALEQRDATLIDIDSRNIDLVDKRLRENVRVLSCDIHVGRVVWTVEAVSPEAVAQHNAGQMELL